MRLNTDHLKCLVVEDDKFKLDSVLAFLREELGPGADISTCDALSTAVAALAQREFNLVVIDMSIPSHPVSVGAGSPYSFPSGGLDVLFEIDAQGCQCVAIILTQYPEIELDGVLVPIDSAAGEIARRFDIEVAGCVQYFEDNGSWKAGIQNILREL